MKLFQKLAGVLAVCGLLPYAHASDPPENDVLAQDSLFADFPEQVQDSNLYHNDPLELLNRFTFALNGAINVLIVRPSTEVYVFFVPEFIRIGIHNFLRNLKEPVVLVNAILQNDAATAQTTGIRFSLNTVFGFGLLDVATNMGYAEQKRGLRPNIGPVGKRRELVFGLAAFRTLQRTRRNRNHCGQNLPSANPSRETKVACPNERCRSFGQELFRFVH